MPRKEPASSEALRRNADLLPRLFLEQTFLENVMDSAADEVVEFCPDRAAAVLTVRTQQIQLLVRQRSEGNRRTAAKSFHDGILARATASAVKKLVPKSCWGMSA